MWEPDTLRGRIGRPWEIGGRHVRKEEEWLREGGPEGLRKAHEARAGHGPEDAGAQGLVQGDREGAGQVASTVSAEVASHRFVTAPKARRGERVDASADLSAACPRSAAWPRCCNGCGRYRAIGCKRRPHVFYEARAAQLCADSVLVSSRRGIDADEPAAAARLEAIRGLPAPGGCRPSRWRRATAALDLSPSTIYRWVSAGYDGMTNMELRRKVGYRPRGRRGPGGDPPLRPQVACRVPRPRGGRACAAAWEMDTVEGAGRTPPACSRCCTAPAGSSSRCRWRRRPPGASRTPEGESRRSSAPTGWAGLPRRPHRQRRRVLRRGGDRGAGRRGAGRDEAVLLRPEAQRPEGRLRAQTTSRSGSCCPRAPESGSTGSPRPTWRWPCRT